MKKGGMRGRSAENNDNTRLPTEEEREREIRNQNSEETLKLCQFLDFRRRVLAEI